MFIVLWTVCVMPVCAQRTVVDTADTGKNAADSIEISLLTCVPGTEIYTLFGHTAVRCHNVTKKRDWVFNYGVFSFKQKNFLWKFATGQTDYELGVMPYGAFLQEYKERGRSVTEQVLLMSPQEKIRLEEALFLNAMPENSVYRYNYFYRNCTTEARDVIFFNGIAQDSLRMETVQEPKSFREIIFQYTCGHPWSRLAMTLCLGHEADVKRTAEELEFLPDNLMRDFNAYRRTQQGSYGMPLVQDQHTVKAATLQAADENGITKFFTPLRCLAVVAVIVICFFFFEMKRKKIYWGLDLVLLSLIGLCGIVLTVVRFSDHPCVSLNANWYLFSPIAFLVMFFDVRACRRRIHTRWWLFYEILFVYLIAIDTIGFQDIPLFSEIVALFLLLRSLTRRIVFSNCKKK